MACILRRRNSTVHTVLASRARQTNLIYFTPSFDRVWKGYCVIRDSAEIERVIREYRKNPTLIREFYIGCDAGFSFSVVRDS